ncbi:MBG domain-containing protein [Martelella sp. FOR1707]
MVDRSFGSQRINVARLSARFALGLLASSALSLPAFAGGALPTGGQVVSGSAHIGSAGGAMTVTQGSDRAIVNWQSFNIGEPNSVDFVQPGVNAAILNRVTGNTRSSIAGALSGNGQVFLVNPNGIAITPTGTVKAGGGFVASTLDITNDDFMSGNMVFRGNGASGTVTNEGVVTIGRGGYVALMGGKVKNSGLIAVPYGKAGLGAGEEITLDLSGDGFMQVAVPSSLIDDGEALVENSGTVTAEGGVIVMKAATARAAARHAVNLSGVAEARSVSGRNGKITLGGGDGGKVTVTGKVSTRAKQAQPKTTRGGAIQITGLEINLDDAVIDASGYGAGGKVRIGGDWQGTGDIPHADILTVSAGTVISADAVSQGNGGSVVLWSDHRTDFAGRISAKGATGTGGDAEVSGKALLSYTGFADLTGAAGFGSLLLDPYNVTISNGDNQTSSGFTASGDNSVINVATLQTALAGANVTVSTGSGGSQDGDITVADAVTWNSGSTLTLSAYRNIAVNANLSGGTGSKIVLRADSGATGNGTVSFGSGIKATASGGVSLYYNPGSYAAPIGYSANAGSGTALTAYMLVNTLDNLQAINTNLSGTYALGSDIDANATAAWNSGAGFEPIGNYNSQFTGTFDGDGHVISGLTINRSGKGYIGLFGYTNSGAVVRDVGLEGGSITGGDSVGGLVGYNYLGTISNAYATGSVTASGNRAGGLVGSNSYGTISDSYATGSVTGSQRVGGLVGFNTNGTIRNAHATGSVAGSDYYVGGLVGYISSGTISDVYATGSVSGSDSFVGGLVGSISSGTISNAYATGSVAGSKDAVGGLVGYSVGTVKTAYATGSVTGGEHVGGLVGRNFSGTISNAYATGSVSGTSSVGGLVGSRSGDTIGNSYFDTQTTGQTNGVGTGEETGVTGLTTAQARSASFYTTFDFTNTWYQAGDMRPILRSEAAAPVDGVISVSNLHQLQLIGANLSASYRLTGDIDASATNAKAEDYDASGIWGTGGFVPIGNNSTSFTGTFDGDGHAITELTIDRSDTSYVGLFGYTGSGAAIRDIGLEGGSVTGDSAVGGLVGYNYGTISNAYATGSVSGYGTLGGLVGLNFTGAISNTYASGSVRGSGDSVGGLVGLNISGAISNAYASGSVTGGENYVGGLVGYNYGTVSNAYATGSVLGSADYVGGLIGFNDGGTITNVYASGSVSSSGDNVGGLVGRNSGTIKASYFDNQTTGQSSGAGSGSASGVTGLTTEQFQDTDYFYTLASAAGWDFETVWAPPSQDYYPELYALSDVVFVKTDGQTITYGEAPGALTYSGVYGGHSGAGDFAPTLTTSATSTSNVGSYAISGQSSFEGDDGITYRAVYGPGVVTINKAKLTVTADDGTMVYGDAVPTDLGYMISGWKNSDSGSVSGVNVVTNATSSSGVGTGYITTASGGSIGSTAAGNYTLDYVDGSFSVTARPITVTADNKSKTYGDAASLTYMVTSGSLVNDDTLTGALASDGAAKTADAKTYDITQGTLSNANYDITYEKGTLTVNKAALKITAKDATKTYGTVADLTAYSVNGLVNEDTVTGVTLASEGSAKTASVDGYDIIASAAAGTGLSNYTISYVDGTLTVNPAALKITAKDASKTYGTVADLTAYSVNGLVNEDTVTGVTLASAGSAKTATVNGYNIIASAATGTGLSNYTIGYVDGTLTVDPATLKITAKDATKTYGNIADLTAYSVNGLVNEDAVTGVTLASAGSAKTATVNGYDIIASAATGAGLSNYTISYANGTLTVNPAALTITATDASKTYGTVANLTGYDVDGLVNEDTVSGVTLASAGSAATANVNDYDIIASAATGTGLWNYTISYADGTLTVDPAALTITAKDASKTYGAVANLTGYDVDGLVNEDTVSGVTLASAGSAATANVNAYDIIASAATGTGLSNYTISYDKGTLTVNKATLLVTADNGSMVYGSTPPADIGYTVSGWRNDDTGSVTGATVVTDATSSSNVGSGYVTTASGGLIAGAAAGNYDLSYAPGSFSVTPRALKITAKDASKTYGDVASLTGYSVNGLVNGDEVKAVDLTSVGRAATADAATYGIVASDATGSGLSNYKINYVDGTLTVNKATLTVTANDGSMIYGDAVPTIGYAVSGWKNGQGDALLTGVNVATNASSISNVGSTYSTFAAGGELSGAALGNYMLNYVDGSFAVTPRALTVTASDAVKTYGDTVSLNGFTVTGLVNGDSVSAVSEKSLGAGAEADVGSYDIVAGGATGTGLSNYVISYDKGTLTVEKAALTVTADNGLMIYGDAVPAIGYAVSGWKNGQNGSLLSGVVVKTDATSSSDVGTGYSTAASGGALSGAALGNYDISYVAGSMTVERRAITVAANAAVKTYGDLGLLSYTVGGMGLVNGDSLSGELESAGVSGLADVGSYAITQGSVTDAANGNYAISYESNTLAVTPRAVTVTANDADKEVGTPAGAFTWFVSAGNLVNGDALSGTLESAGAPADAPVGVYAITAGSLTDAQNSNYAINFVPGELEVLSIPAPAVAGSLPLPEAQFGPGGFAGPGGSMAFFGLRNPGSPLILADQSLDSFTLCGTGAQTLIVCR